MQASKGWKERSKGLPGVPRCGNGECSCVHERVTPKKWRWLPSRVERKSVYNCKASCFHHQVLQSRNSFLLNFPISFLDFFKHVVSFLIICLENSFLEYCFHANQELKNQTQKSLMSLGWAICHFRQDHNGKKNPNSQLFSLIQVQLFSFSCNKNSNNFLCPYRASNSWNNLRFYHPLPPKKSNFKSKASYRHLLSPTASPSSEYVFMFSKKWSTWKYNFKNGKKEHRTVLKNKNWEIYWLSDGQYFEVWEA